jgi:hypothetical protein
MFNEKDVLDAVQRRLGDHNEIAADLPGAAEVTWHPLLEGKIERCIEIRTEKKQQHHGPKDLSRRPVYDTLHGHQLDPPTHPFAPRTMRLVQRDSVLEQLCDCGNGQITCQRCQGRGELPCEATIACTDCHGIDPCMRCHGTGRRKSKALTADKQQAADRVTCRKCGSEDAACSACKGQGRLPCPTCQGKEIRPCPDCDGAGTVDHKRCGGTGGTVTWTEGIIDRTLQTQQVRLPQSGIPVVTRWLAREGGHWQKTSLARRESVPADLAREFASLRNLLAPQAGEIERQVTLRYLRVARVMVRQQPHRVYYVFPGPESLQVRVLPSQHRTWQITAAALVALALLIVLLNIT